MINAYYTLRKVNNMRFTDVTDYGKNPFMTNLEDVTEENTYFRRVLWTGDNFQLVLMSIPVGEEIGLEIHPDIDQFFMIEEGIGKIYIGDNQDNLFFQRIVHEGDAIIVPQGMWHNLVNIGNEPLKLFTIYAPVEHPFGKIDVQNPNRFYYYY